MASLLKLLGYGMENRRGEKKNNLASFTCDIDSRTLEEYPHRPNHKLHDVFVGSIPQYPKSPENFFNGSAMVL